MANAAEQAGLTIDHPEAGLNVRLSGPWLNSTIARLDTALTDVEKASFTGPARLDLGDITGLDTAGAWMIRRMMTMLEKKSDDVALSRAQPGMSELIAALPSELSVPDRSDENRGNLFQRLMSPLGEAMVTLFHDMIQALDIVGSAVRGAQLKLGRASGLSPASVFNQVQQMGLNATPIIALMSFLIGAIIAQQGAFQLRYFGAEVFVVDLVGILQLREIGVLLTAIMVAGRSGSAITAEIGSMKMREEIDALQVMGLNPVGVLIFPRLLALMISLPLLTVIANFAALAGAAVVADIYSGVTYAVFLSRLQQAIDLSTVVSGMLKAPFMAVIIGVVASVEGLQVGGSAESLGKHVTAAVVKAIFVVIMVDGLFAMFYAAIDF
jgi:phospholipid/cholesterol/gamma-HCH transport system permease protein